MTGLDNGGGLCEWGSPSLEARLPTWELNGGGYGLEDTPDQADWKGLELSAMAKGERATCLAVGWGGAPEREKDVRRRSPGLGARGYRLADLVVQRKAVGELRPKPLGTWLTRGGKRAGVLRCGQLWAQASAVEVGKAT